MVEVDEHHFGLDPGQFGDGILHDGMGYLRKNGPKRTNNTRDERSNWPPTTDFAGRQG